LLDLRHPIERRDGLGDDRAERGRRGRQRLGLDQHVLGLLVGLEAAVTDDVIGRAGLADVEVVLVDELRRDRDPDGECGDHERKPAEDGGLAVPRAPATHPGRDVGAALQR
jgi:hypothetical protein